MTSLFRPAFLFGRPTTAAPAPAAPPPPGAPPPPPPPPPPAPAPLGRDAWLPSAPRPAQAVPAATTGHVDGQAPDPRALRAAIVDYRAAILANDAANSSQLGLVFSGLGGSGDRPIMLLQGSLLPHTVKLLSLAWLGREATPAEQARYDELARTRGREALAAISAEIGNRGMLARLRRTDGSPAALEAIQRQVAGMLIWTSRDTFSSVDPAVRPIPPGPALDPVRDAVSSPGAGTPHADRANSPAAQAALAQAIAAYGAAVTAPGTSELTWILSGRLSSDTVYLLPGLMLPHGARMMMLAWLGREPNTEELTRWQGWSAGAGGRDARTAFGDVMRDIERTGLAARLPETDGTPEAVTRLRQEIGAKMRWR